MIKNKYFFLILTFFNFLNAQDSKNPNEKSLDKSDKPIQKLEKEESKSKKINAEYVEANFNGLSLNNFINYIEKLFDVKFLIEEAKEGQSRGPQEKTKKLSDIKISYNSTNPVRKQKIWNLLNLFLENAGYAAIPQKNIGKNVYSIMPLPNSNKSVLPLYVGNDPSTLPDSGRIRYIYFLKESSVKQMSDLLSKLTGGSGSAITSRSNPQTQIETYDDLRALIVTGSSYNIKSLFNIVKELDNGSKPELLSILRLQNANANDVVNVYNSLQKKDETIFGRGFDDKKESGSYFPSDAKVVAEPRTNSLIVLGDRDAVRRIEDFVINHLDTRLKKLPSPIHVYQLEYAPADQVAKILNSVVKYGNDDESIKNYGGVRAGQKFFTKVHVEADKQGNRLLIRCSEEDFKMLKPTIAELDEIQMQVVIEVLIVNLRIDNTKAINSALRNLNNSKVNFQTSGFQGQGIQVNSNSPEYTGSLITNLINLAKGAVAGSTVLTLGKESVWGLLSVIDKVTKVNIVSNPFLVATNKYRSEVALGQQRRVKSGSVIGSGSQNPQDEFSDISAEIKLKVTPQINHYGVINMSVEVTVEEFTAALNPNDPSSANKSIKTITTNADVANKEVLALGGLIQTKENNNNSGFPILQDLPLVGYLFKNKNKSRIKDNLLIFLTPKVISPQKATVSKYTKQKGAYIKDFLCDIEAQESQKDPIYQYWFKDKNDTNEEKLDKMLSKNQKGGSK